MISLKRILSPLQNCEETALVLCRELDVPVTEKTLVNDLTDHPDYPSLLCMSDIMSNLGVANASLKTDFDNLKKLSFPLVVQVKFKKSRYDLFALIYSINESEADWLNPESKKREKFSAEKLAEIYRGVVQLYEKTESDGEKEYAVNRKKEKTENVINLLLALSIPVVTLLISAFAFSQHGFNAAILPFTYTLLALGGVVTGALLLLYEVDQYNPVLQKVCTAGGKTNCAAILHSKGSKVFGISWSVIGFSYFMGQLATLLLSGFVNAGILSVAAWLSVLVLPYTIYSIYYQKQAVRQWCPMCLAVQGVLVLQFLTALGGQFFTPMGEVSLISVFPFIISMLVAFLAVYLLLPALEKAKANKHHRAELQRLKHNPQIFDALLTRQKRITNPTEGLGIILGNPAAKYKITKVCNPYCGPCSDAHPVMESLLDNNPDLQLQIIFTASDDEKDMKNPPAKHLLAIAGKEDHILTRKAIDDWYMAKKKDYTLFANKYPLDKELNHQSEKIKTMREWCDKEEITFTPTFFINGYQLPEMYSVADLKYFLSV